MKSRIVLDFLRMRDSALSAFATSVYAAMNGNPHFPTPMPSLGELNTATSQYSAAMDASRNYDRLRAQEKRNARTALEGVLKRLSSYVMTIAGDDRAIQLSSGFHVTSQPSATALGDMETFTVVLGSNSGEVLMSAYAKNALTYSYSYALAGIDNPVWKTKTVAESELLLTGLEPLKTYRFRVTAVGNKKQSVSSEEIVKPVL